MLQYTKPRLSLLLRCVSENALDLYQAWVYLKFKRIFSSHPSLSFLLKKSSTALFGQTLFVYLLFLSLTNYIFVKTASFSTFVYFTWPLLKPQSFNEGCYLKILTISLSNSRTKITWTVSPPWKKKGLQLCACIPRISLESSGQIYCPFPSGNKWKV